MLIFGIKIRAEFIHNSHMFWVRKFEKISGWTSGSVGHSRRHIINTYSYHFINVRIKLSNHYYQNLKNIPDDHQNLKNIPDYPDDFPDPDVSSRDDHQVLSRIFRYLLKEHLKISDKHPWWYLINTSSHMFCMRKFEKYHYSTSRSEWSSGSLGIFFKFWWFICFVCTNLKNITDEHQDHQEYFPNPDFSDVLTDADIHHGCLSNYCFIFKIYENSWEIGGTSLLTSI